MKNLKFNLKRFLMRNMLAMVLLTTPATLTGCGKDTEIEEETEPTYVWADSKGVIEYTPNETNEEEIQIIHYVDSEGLLKTAYIDTQALDKYLCEDPNGVTIYEVVDEQKLNRFISKHDLISIPDNIDALIEATKDNNLYLSYEYYENGGEKEYSGNTYLNVHYYQTYKIIINEKGNYELVEGPAILNMEDWYKEYPYVKEDYDKVFAYDISDLSSGDSPKKITNNPQRKNKKLLKPTR